MTIVDIELNEKNLVLLDLDKPNQLLLNLTSFYEILMTAKIVSLQKFTDQTIIYIPNIDIHTTTLLFFI